MIHPIRAISLLAICFTLASGVVSAWAEAATRAPVHPRRNVEEFAAREVRRVRFIIHATTRGEPCLDELEIYGPDQPERNLALADSGAVIRASGTLAEYSIHALRHLNDGLYGNGHSWICNSAKGWVEVEWPAAVSINRIVWSRDRLGKFIDRLVTDYQVETSLDGLQTEVVSSSQTRRPIEISVTSQNSVRSGSEAFLPGSIESPGPSGLASKEYTLTTWRSDQGLPANGVTAILQTTDHWLWIGTTNGLVQFDGMQFSAQGTSALKGLRILSLHADRNGKIWAGTDSGLFEQVEGKFISINGQAGLPEKTILALTTDGRGALWVGTSGGLYENVDGRFLRRCEGSVSRLAVDASREELWLLRQASLMRWNGGLVSPAETASEPARFGALAALALDSQGAVWFGGGNEYVATLRENSVTSFAQGHALFTTPLREILPSSNGDVWLGTAGSGLARMRDGKILPLGPEDGLPSNSFNALCEDTEGNIWVGGGDGLTRISRRRCDAVTMNDGLSYGVVMSVAEDSSGRLWLGTNGGGLNRWSQGKVEPFAPSYQLDNEVIPALLATKKGAVWAGTLSSGLAIMDGDKVSFLTKEKGLVENATTAFCEDNDGNVWVGSPSSGIVRIQAGEGTQPPGCDALKGERITTMLADSGGNIWIGTAGQGLAMLQAEELKRWNTVSGLAGNYVRALHVDGAGTLWVGTSNGLSRWSGGGFESFTAAHGLPDEVISQIVDDGMGCLWLGTNRGIVRVPLIAFDGVRGGRVRQLEILQLDKSDGLPSLECTGGFQQAAMKLRDGRLVFGTAAGVAVVDPKRFSMPLEAPPVFIEMVSPLGAVRDDASNRGRAVFQFTALAFTAPQRLKFRYRLEGMDLDWSVIGAKRSASYEFLPSGSYRFQVQASLDGSSWGMNEIAFTIPTPWWKTPWSLGVFIVSGVVSLIVIVRFLTRRRFKRRLLEMEQKLALERERSRIARDIHDQLGANLTHIALLSAGAHEQLSAPDRERFQSIAASSNELVQSVDAIVWAVNPRHSTMESLARYLSRFASDFLAAAQLSLRLDFPVHLPEIELNPELRHSLFLAVREALNNCVRHSGATEVHLRLQLLEHHFKITISDNGRGFDPSEMSLGDGLDNMRRRLIECHGACEIDTSPNQGTIVSLSVPLPTSP